MIGSANFDNRSFELNDEITVAVDDAALAGELTEAFEQDLTRSKRLTVEEWRRRPVTAADVRDILGLVRRSPLTSPHLIG